MNYENKPLIVDKKNKSNGRYQNSGGSLITLKEITKIYESGGGSFTALRGVSLVIDEGEFVAIAGKSGSGKSTLLNMVTGIDRPTSGEIVINGTQIHLLSEGKLAVWRGSNLGIVFQFFQLLPTLTVLENIMIPMDFCHKFSLKVRKERALHLLEEVDLLEQATKLPSNLSGGQQQRVAIARALANDPPILVADEPTGNLDTKTAEGIFNLFFRMVDQGKTIIMVTHDLELAKKLSRTIVISDGLIQSDSKRQEGEGIYGIDGEKVSWTANDLVKLKIGNEEGNQFSIEEEYESLLHERIRNILLDQTNSASRLQEEFINASGDEKLMQSLYSAVIQEAQFLSDQAESEQRLDDARRIWKIVMDAARPWVKPT
jgi:putative ABC transport system ATP-binding protein